MYTKPDFIKVDVDVKDNFAAYGACTPKYLINKYYTNVNTGCDTDFDFQVTNSFPQIEATPWVCYENKDET